MPAGGLKPTVFLAFVAARATMLPMTASRRQLGSLQLLCSKPKTTWQKARFCLQTSSLTVRTVRPSRNRVAVLIHLEVEFGVVQAQRAIVCTPGLEVAGNAI